MKRKGILFISIIFGFALIFLLAGTNESKAYDVTASDGVVYTGWFTDGVVKELRVKSVPAGTTEINIPASLTYGNTQYPVRELGQGTNYIDFLSNLTYDEKKLITKITVPDSVTKINDYCFYNIYNLETLTLGNSLTTIGNNAIYSLKINEVVLPDSLTTIGSYNFWSCSSIKKVTIGKNAAAAEIALFKGYILDEVNVSSQCTDYVSIDNVIYTADMKKIVLAAANGLPDNYTMPNTVEEIDSYAFSRANIPDNFTFSNSLKTIGSSAFSSANFNRSISLPNSLISIGNSAFSSAKLKGELVIPNSVTNIGSSAFSYNDGLTSLNLGTGIQTVGSSAFNNCTGLSGNITYNPSVTRIEGSTFANTNYSKFVVGSNITNIASYAFEGYTDLWIDNTPENVTLGTSVNGRTNNEGLHIHWRGETHNLFLNKLPGVKLINTATNQEITSGDYDCGTTFSYRVEVEDGYSYSNLNIIVINDNDYGHPEIISVNANEVYEFNELIRDRIMLIQNISTTTDLALRTYIKQVNGLYLDNSRAPRAEIVDGSIKYIQTKYPVTVKKDNIITLAIRVYNESLVDGDINKIAVYLPEGIEFISGDSINTIYGWTLEDGKYTSAYLDGTIIAKYNGLGNVSYVEIPIRVKVTADQPTGDPILRAIFAEIDDGDDTDSTAGNVDTSNMTSYMSDEIYASDESSIIDSQEDDDDFDTVTLKSTIKVEYNLKVDKIAADNDELLAGATFELYDADNNLITSADSDENGSIDFGKMTTYGEGIDVYYIKETKTPTGFYLPEGKSIKIEVEKKIIDEVAGTYSVTVRCDTREYTIDTSKLEFIPIYNKDQLKFIGSGDTIQVLDETHVYSDDANYKLMNDIDLAGEDWEPISVEFKGVLDGNGHKISNLTINKATPTVKEIGLFSVCSGIVENLELDDVSITVGAYDENATSITGKSGVGAYAGVMRNGYIMNCKVSGTIDAVEDNVGGFVGHTLENNIVIVDNFENNATITGHTTIVGYTTTGTNNIGGCIGCALGSVSVNNSINKGTISGGMYNNGGLVGYVLPSRYQDLSVSGANNEDAQELEFYVTNTEFIVEGEYNVTLQTIKKSDDSLLPGATYTVYDANKNVISGLDHIVLETGSLELFTKTITAVGTDTYYIEENETVPGYAELSDIIRADVERYWDEATNDYKVRVSTTRLSDEDYESDTAEDTNISSRTGIFLNKEEIFTETNVAKANWRTSKAEFINCSNTGSVSGIQAVAGIVGASHGYTCIEDCSNSGEISTSEDSNAGKVAGIIGDLIAWKIGDKVTIDGCTNTGKITGTQSSTYYSTAGIVAEVIGDARITDCTNSGEITSTGGDCVSGVAGEILGKIEISNCSNSGSIVCTYRATKAGGIVGQNYGPLYIYNVPVLSGVSFTRADNEIIINNCTCTGTMESAGHTSGIIAFVCANECEISDCSVEDLTIKTYGKGDLGAIVGMSNTPSQKISNCSVENYAVTYADDYTYDTEGHVGGIIGNWSEYGGSYSSLGSDTNIEIVGCSVIDSQIVSYKHQVGGILGEISSKGNAIISNCSVSDSVVKGDEAGSTQACAGGILGGTYNTNEVVVNNCCVDRTDVSDIKHNEEYGGDPCVGGIVGETQGNKASIKDCTYSNGTVLNEFKKNSTATTGGIIGYGAANKVNLENLNVSNANIETHSANLGGIIGISHYSNGSVLLNVTNCHVKDTNIINYSVNVSTEEVTGGIIAYAEDGGTFTDCSVEGCKIMYDPESETYNDGGSGVAGIVGMARDRMITLNRCKAIDCEVINKGSYNGYGATAGGLVGYANSGLTMSDCEVTKCKVKGIREKETFKGPANVGGVVGGASSNVIIRNCTEFDCEVSNDNLPNQGSNSTVGGFMGMSSSGITMENVDVSKVSVTGNTTVIGGVVAFGGGSSGLNAKNVNVSEVTVTDTGTNSGRHRSAGGLLGYNSSSITDCTLDKITINSAVTAVGGVVGVGAGELANINASNISINNDQGENESVSTSYANAAAGGIVGSGGSKLTNVNIDTVNITTNYDTAGGLCGYTSSANINNCSVSNANITVNNNDDIIYLGCGGIAGSAGEGVVINNTSVSDSEILLKSNENNEIRNAGGFIGFAISATISNSEVDNTTVTNQMGTAGGFVGVVDKEDAIGTLTISNSTVKGDTTVSGSEISGGIAAFTKLIASDITLNGVTVSSSNSGSVVGGLIAVSEEDSSIDGVTATSVTVNSKNGVGGIAAVFKGTMNGIEISESTVTTTANDDDGYAGGIVGVLEGTLSNSTVDGVNVTSAGGDAGGAVGSTTGTVNTVTVKNSTIQSPKIVGGVVGTGVADATTLTSLTIDNNTLTTTGTSGNYIGSPNIYNP